MVLDRSWVDTDHRLVALAASYPTLKPIVQRGLATRSRRAASAAGKTSRSRTVVMNASVAPKPPRRTWLTSSAVIEINYSSKRQELLAVSCGAAPASCRASRAGACHIAARGSSRRSPGDGAVLRSPASWGRNRSGSRIWGRRVGDWSRAARSWLSVAIEPVLLRCRDQRHGELSEYAEGSRPWRRRGWPGRSGSRVPGRSVWRGRGRCSGGCGTAVDLYQFRPRRRVPGAGRVIRRGR